MKTLRCKSEAAAMLPEAAAAPAKPEMAPLHNDASQPVAARVHHVSGRMVREKLCQEIEMKYVESLRYPRHDNPQGFGAAAEAASRVVAGGEEAITSPAGGNSGSPSRFQSIYYNTIRNGFIDI